MNKICIPAIIVAIGIIIGFLIGIIWKTEPWWFSGVITLAGIVSAVSMAIYQIRIQYQHKLKLEIYEKIAERIDEVNKNSLIIVHGFMPVEMLFSVDTVKLQNDYNKFYEAVAEIISLWEIYEIVLQEFRIYHIAFRYAQSEFGLRP